LIVNGQTQTDIAQLLGIAPSTVKTHLLKVFQKTGTARQADLVRLASQLVAAV
jgi:DNA-binding CsgD family transcriptional regulator